MPTNAGGNSQVSQDVETTPLPPWPPATIKAQEEGDVVLRVTLEKGKVVEVVTISGPSALALPAARWIEAHWKLRPEINGAYETALKFSFHNPALNAAAYVRIIEKNGQIIEVAPVNGSSKAAAAAVDLVKKKWKFSPGKSLIVVLPVEVQQAK